MCNVCKEARWEGVGCGDVGSCSEAERVYGNRTGMVTGAPSSCGVGMWDRIQSNRMKYWHSAHAKELFFFQRQR